MTLASVVLAAVACLGFFALMFLGSKVLPGRIVQGGVNESGAPKQYRLNGLALFLLTAVAQVVIAWSGLWSPAAIFRYFPALFVTANAFTLLLGFLLFFEGRRAGHGLGVGPANKLHDFLWGTRLNPEWRGVDLKMFSYRPSLIGLGLINVSFAFVQYQAYGELTARMWLYQLFYFGYLANYFQFEHGMLFTWDVLVERLGFLLIWGNYVLVPFFYSLPGWYLLDNPEPLRPAAATGLVLLYLFGFWLFRGANEQKHRFKINPRAEIWGKPAQTIGEKLLVSGFWGIGRKLNYTGELCLYWAWTLLCGSGSFVPYLLPLWLTLLLCHRAWRDEKRCRQKYGELWLEYCRHARFRMLPFLY